ncbi:MAG TPA: hypothetical protein VGE83_09730 [Terracidiphilus sp.]
MAVLSVDLAYRRWSDLGIVVLDRVRLPQASNQAETGHGLPLQPMFSNPDQPKPAEYPIACEIISSMAPDDNPGPVDANVLAGRLNHLCGVRGIRVMMLDGPQAWKSRSNGLEYSRVSERQLNTAAKTGLPGMVKPLTYRPFAEFCLDVYDALCRRGWRRLETRDQPGSPPERVLVESYPHAAWKSLGLKPLPSKRRTEVSHLAEAYGALRSLIPITTDRPPNHDQLQAIVGGLPGLALEEHNNFAARIVGNPPRREDGHWREGFIVLPLPPPPPMNMSWLNSMRWLD